MTQAQSISQQTIEEVLTTWPETAVVFKRHNMACIGCDVAHFFTVAEAASVYELPVEAFVTELQAAIGE